MRAPALTCATRADRLHALGDSTTAMKRCCMDVPPTKSVRARRALRPPQRFTVASADRTLPLVRRIVADIVEEYSHINSLESHSEEASAAGRTEALTRLRDEHSNRLERLR